jgi:hypothetical protein
MAIQKLLKHISLEKQFERRQAAWQPNMHVQEDVELYRIDGVLMQEYTPPSATNEHTMVCFSPQAWQAVVHDNESDCSTP